MANKQKGKPPRGSGKGFKCETPYCRNRKARKGNGYFLRLCWKCRSRQLKERHPATYVMNALRQRARKRRIPWGITLADFKTWCAQTGYLVKRGHGKGLATIDRINANEGYHIGNIQILEYLENCTKGHYVPGMDCKQNDSMPEENKLPLSDLEGEAEAVYEEGGEHPF